MNFFADNWNQLLGLFIAVVMAYLVSISLVISAIDNVDSDDSKRTRRIKEWIAIRPLAKIMVLGIAPLLVGMFGLYLCGMVFRIIVMEEIPSIAGEAKDFLAKK